MTDQVVTYQLDIVRHVLLMTMPRWRVRQLRSTGTGLSSAQLQRLEIWLARRLRRLRWTYVGPMEASVITDGIVPADLRHDGVEVNLWMTNRAALVLRAKVVYGLDIPPDHMPLLYRTTAQVLKIQLPGYKKPVHRA